MIDLIFVAVLESSVDPPAQSETGNIKSPNNKSKLLKNSSTGKVAIFFVHTFE